MNTLAVQSPHLRAPLPRSQHRSQPLLSGNPLGMPKDLMLRT